MPAPPVIADLVERFEQQADAFKSGQYNEAQLRKEFVDPMFKALGWDMDNVSGYAEAYKDVIHEDAIKIGGATKAPDDLTPELEIDDAILKKIIRRLYYPDSPYEFSVLPADILGQVYEQFLGKVIRLTEGHQAKVEDKPEVKNAGGVYCTPTCIVDYIRRQKNAPQNHLAI